MKGNGTMQGARPNPNTGATPTTPAIQRDHHTNRRGTPTADGGRTLTFEGEPVTPPPFTHHATHHPLRYPPFHDGPTHHSRRGGVDRGYPTTRTAQTRTHHPHTTHLARNSARHDSSTRQHCSGMSRARAAPPHWTGQQQHTPPSFHTPRGWTPSTHPLIYSHSFMFTQSTNDHDQ